MKRTGFSIMFKAPTAEIENIQSLIHDDLLVCANIYVVFQWFFEWYFNANTSITTSGGSRSTGVNFEKLTKLSAY